MYGSSKLVIRFLAVIELQIFVVMCKINSQGFQLIQFCDSRRRDGLLELTCPWIKSLSG